MTCEQAPPDLAARIDALQIAVTALEKQISRAGREQLKANALSETQAERLSTAMNALRAAEERHTIEIDANRQQIHTAVSDARLAVVRAMFPTLDGLDEAIRAGQATLNHAVGRESADALLRRLLLGAAESDKHREVETLYAALNAWLGGLTMVRRRLLDALTAEGVTPIVAEGLPFDPRHHIAIEVVTANTVPGTVVQEIRRGFMVGTRVLRHAEVSVAAEPPQ